MSAIAMIRELADTGIRLSVNGDKLHVQAVPGTITPELRQRLLAHKADLLRALATSTGLRHVVEYQLADSPQWLVMLGASGASYAETVVALHLQFRGRVVDARPHNRAQRHACANYTPEETPYHGAASQRGKPHDNQCQP